MTPEQTKPPYYPVEGNSYYRVGGTLPPHTPSYVRREADEQLYQKLKQGEFCYVLNCRQMGKSSLWVRVKQRLEKENYICAAIDLSGIGQGDKQEWYGSLASELLGSFAPEVKKKWRLWRKEEERQELTPIKKLHQLIEELLLPSLLPHQKLVIFIDEIDYVKGLPFSTDEFFALIRSCYNDRSLNPQFDRVTFCLLGVATPADLIQNKQLTPFNIGTGIELQGFRLEEAEPLIKGLKGKVTSPESVMSDILYWTGGQPFLTQRLCNLVVQENNPTPDLTELVHRRIIDNWETQDEQEHLRTIQNRILSNEQRAGYLLELYRQVLKQGQVPLNNSSEERELQLSGLVVKKNNALEVYNPIYAKVFNEAWLDSELAKLRPYAENFRAWIQSGKTDASRLLRGQALKDAETWAKEQKNLGGEDQDFLGASRAKERETEANQKAQRRIFIGSIILGITLLGTLVSAGIGYWQLQDTKAELEQIESQADRAKQREEEANKKATEAKETEAKYRSQVEEAEKNLDLAKKEQDRLKQEVKKSEKTVREAEKKAEKAEQLKRQANQESKDARKAKVEVENALQKAQDDLAKTNEALKAVRGLSQLAGELRKKGKESASDEALRKAGLSTLIKNEELKQTFLLAATAEAYGNQEQEKAQETLNKLNLDPLNNNKSQLDPGILNQVRAFAYFQAGRLKDKKYYQSAYKALKASNFNPYALNVETDILTKQDVENIHYRLIQSDNIDINSESNEIASSFRKHLYDGLEFLLKQDRLAEADRETFEIMLYIANQREDAYFKVESLENFSCPALRQLDALWYNYRSKPQHFGFRVQKEIWQEVGSPDLNSPNEDWRKFYIRVGWKTEESGIYSSEGYVNDDNLGGFRDLENSKRGNLPWSIFRRESNLNLKRDGGRGRHTSRFLAVRTVTCKI